LTQKELAKIPSHLLRQSPFQTPRITPYFVGREKEIDKISKILTRKQGSLIAIYGLPGVGKTVLAIRVAQLLQNQFPDGILWSRLDICSPINILAKIANTYGKDIAQIKDLQARSELVRSMLAHKKALLIFDNAQSSKQLQPLLPGNTKCSVIVTSRNSSLAALSDAAIINLKPFSFEENTLFFTKKLGQKWVKIYKKQAEQISKLTGSLPLALDIAINKIKKSTKETLNNFIQQLKKEKNRLTDLAYEDVNVRSSLKLSYKSLDLKEKAIFDCLGVFAGVDFSLEAIQAILGKKKTQAKRGLDKLVDKSLLEHSVKNRYRLHSLIRLYAREKIKGKTPYLKLAGFYSRKLDEIVGKWTFEKYQLIEKEVENILGLCWWLLEQKEIDILDKVWKNFSQFLFEIGLWEELLLFGEKIFKSCHLPKHQKIKTESTVNLLSWTALWQGNLGRAQKLASEGLAIAEKIKDKHLIALAKLRLGNIFYYRKNYPQAEELLVSSQKMFEKLGNQGRAARALIYLAHIPQKQGDLKEALKVYKKALKVSKKINDKRAQCVALTNLGNVAREEGEFGKARSFIIKSKRLAKKTKRNDACNAWNDYRLAFLEWDLSNWQQAENYLLKARKKFKQLDMKGVLKDTDIVLKQLKKRQHNKKGLYW